MKKQIALAAVLAAVLTLTACSERSENKSGGGSTSVSNTETSSKASDNKSVPKPSSDASYTPVVNDVGEIKTEGNTQYFECTSKYGDAFTSVYRYTFKNGKLSDASSKIIPGKETELAVILENMGEGSGSVKASDFKQDGDGWIMMLDQETIAAYQSIDIVSLRDLTAMSMSSGSDSPNAPSASDSIPNTSDTTPDPSDPVIVVSAENDHLYEPVQTACGEIVTYGDDQYFDSFTYHGTACTIVYRYYFTNGIFDHAEMRVKPNAIPDFKEIYDRHYVSDIARYDFSDFVKESDDSWLLTNTTYLKEESQFFEGVDIYSMHNLMQSMVD